mgnify:CR=1 FL=1
MTKKEFIALYAEKANFEIKADAERKLDAVLDLFEEILIKVESPSDLHSWNGSEWYLDEEKVRISKLPTKEDILNAKIELKVLELLSQLELI